MTCRKNFEVVIILPNTNRDTIDMIIFIRVLLSVLFFISMSIIYMKCQKSATVFSSTQVEQVVEEGKMEGNPRLASACILTRAEICIRQAKVESF